MTSSDKYQSPNIKITINNQSVEEEFLEDILHLSIEESLNVPNLLTLVINNDYYSGRPQQDPPWKHDNLLQIGNSITVVIEGSKTAEFQETSAEKLFEGEITAVECHFTDESQAPIIVRGYDISHRLHRGRYNRSYQDVTAADIVKKIAQEVDITTETVEENGGVYEYLFQENQTNMEFLRERAFVLGCQLYVKDNKLNFCKPKAQDSLNLKWLRDLNSFRVKVNSAEQISSVEVRGWDYKQKEPIVATASQDEVITENKSGKGRETSNKFKLYKNTNAPKMVVVDKPVFKNEEAEQIAQAIYNELSGEYITADARGEGNTKIRVGKIVNIEDMGRYDGQYYITETRHLYHKRVYTTEFSVRGLRGDNLYTVVSPQTYLQPGQTLLVGIVTDNQDPEEMGRVRVKFPTLTEDHNSNWARVVTIGAGSDRGIHWLPEINDEVLVGFEHGDIHRPYVVGNVWNGSDKTPENVENTVVDDLVRLRTVKTRTGHILQFVEEDKDSSKAGCYIKTAGGHEININDSDQVIEIKTTKGHEITLDDKNQVIEIKTSQGHSLKMDDRGKSVVLNSTGDLEIKATGNITIEGAMIYLN